MKYFNSNLMNQTTVNNIYNFSDLQMSQTTKELKQIIESLKTFDKSQTTHLLKQSHQAYMKMNLHNLGKSIIFFDFGQTWIYYYILNTLSNLKAQVSQSSLSDVTKALQYCWNQKKGGFGGGYMQLPHLAPTYAAFLTTLLIGSSAYKLLDRDGLTKFFWSCKKEGKFQMTHGAQTDLRAAYIVTIIVKLLHLDEDLLKGVAETIIAAQTYQGGLSNVEGGQAHGGYTFCGVAALSMLGRLEQLDIARLTFWLSRRQCQFGGFNGRTNKLLDSCYSFWVGAIFNVINNYFQNKISYENHLIYSEQNLQNYVTFYCQDVKGGLRDKPSKNRDIYHTCYALSGLALSQQKQCVREEDKLIEIDPIYNVDKKKLETARQYFNQFKQKK